MIEALSVRSKCLVLFHVQQFQFMHGSLSIKKHSEIQVQS